MNRRQLFQLSMRSSVALLGIIACVLPGAASASALLQVGPERKFKSLAAAARSAPAGAVIEVDAGDYGADVAVWTQSDLTIRAVGGRVRLLANGAAAEAKGIWVVRAENLHVEGVDFEGAAVASRNGAGIRLERGSLHAVDCRFRFNEMGLLTNNDPATRLSVTRCEFANNQRPDGHNHNLYAGRIAELRATGCYFHHARTGHLLKSRAAVNQIFYNRLTDEAGGSASYELEFPNGGLACVVGNIIEQGPNTENPYLVRYGAEQLTWSRNEIYLVNNTLVDDLPGGGYFLGTIAGTSEVLAINNLLLGSGRIETGGGSRLLNNYPVGRDAFEQDTPDDYRLKASSGLIGKALPPLSLPGIDLTMQAEYVHPRGVQPLRSFPHNPGAIQRVALAPKQ